MRPKKASRPPSEPLEAKHVMHALSAYRFWSPGDIAERLRTAGVDADADGVEILLLDAGARVVCEHGKWRRA